MEDNFIIDIHDFNLSYGSVQLFNNFNFKLKKGNCAGIWGPTGKGKTSLLNKIVKDYIYKYKISYIFQDNKLLEGYSVEKNIIIPLKNIFSKKMCEKKVYEILELFNLKEKINEKVSVLSGGERQRVNIARAFAYASFVPCDIMLLDEAFSAQDAENRENIITLIKTLCKKKMITSVVVSHDKNDLNELCDFILEI